MTEHELIAKALAAIHWRLDGIARELRALRERNEARGRSEHTPSQPESRTALRGAASGERPGWE